MARAVVIGGSGHVGTYLVPMLVARGHEVINVSRGKAVPYRLDPAWAFVREVAADRAAEDASGTFGARIAALNADIVIDMISFDLPSTRQIVEALRGRVEHFFHCGTIWVYGQNISVPATEDDPLVTFGDYGVQKAAIESWLLHEARRTGFPATVFRPGRIVGPGWVPVNPVGNVNPQVFSRIARGEELALPNFGLETVHHVHAADVAQLVMCAIANRHAAVGEAFNAVSPQAINLRGYAEAMFRWFGHEPKLRFQPFDEWKEDQTPEFARHSWEHIIRSSCHSIEKARTRLNYAPRYSSLEAVQGSVAALIAAGKIETPRAWTQA
jgi:nucleoside-diphosphate-sugar epimerase